MAVHPYRPQKEITFKEKYHDGYDLLDVMHFNDGTIAYHLKEFHQGVYYYLPHRSNGPAELFPDGSKKYYLFGTSYDKLPPAKEIEALRREKDIERIIK